MSRLNGVLTALADKTTLTTEFINLSGSAIPSKDASNYTANVQRTGYTPIAIVAISKTGGGSGYIVPTAWYISEGTASVTLYNMHTSQLTPTVNVRVLYQKNPS